MTMRHTHVGFAEAVRDFVRRDFHPYFGELQDGFDSSPAWQRLREIGSDLWLDTGSLEDAAAMWVRQFSALTTNNTLLNREVQKGAYDGLIPEARALLADRPRGRGRR